MKTIELIERLQKADPSGENHVSIGGCGIIDVYPSPAYYDGRQEILVLDQEKGIVGAKIKESGVKIVIISESIKDVLLDNPELSIDFSDIFYEESRRRYIDEYEKYREYAREFNAKYT